MTLKPVRPARRPTRSELLGRIPVFLLEILWSGRTFRFSTRPIAITSSDGISRDFEGGLGEVEYAEDSSQSGGQEPGPSIPFEVVFPVDVAEWEAAGRHLDAATGTLSMVLATPANSSGQSWENRFRLVEGRVVMPQYAFPGQPVGYATFSLESIPSTESRTLLDPAAVITTTTWPSADSAAVGKPYPIPIGTPGVYRSATGTSTNTSGSPAYRINTTGGSERLLIADGIVVATTVRVYDESSASEALAVTLSVDGLGRGVTTVNISAAAISRTDSEYWVVWSEGGGGIPDPIDGGVLRGAGNVLVWLLLQSGVVVDIPRWIAARGLLNRVIIGTYYNNPSLTPYDAAMRIARELDIEIRQGADGLYPVVSWLGAGALDAIPVNEGEDFSPAGPVSTSDLADVINQSTIQFAPRARTGVFKRSLTVGPSRDPDNPEQFTDEYAGISASRYGLRSETAEIPWLYDDVSVGLLLTERIRARGFPSKTRAYDADPSWGWLRVGDTLSLTSSSLGLTDRLCQVVGLRWASTHWRLLLLFRDDPLRDGIVT